MKRLTTNLGALTVAVAMVAAAVAQDPPTNTPQNNRPINIHVIGFSVDQNTAEQLQAMAQAGGGRYYPAENEAQLSAALGQAAGISLTPVLTNENEGNSRLGESNFVNPTGAVAGSIDPAGDRDWYTFEVERQGVLHVSITNVAPNLEIVARVSNAERSVISGWLKPLAAGGETTGEVAIPSDGRYYIQLEDNGNDAASPDAYSLNLRFEPGDAYESNGSLGTATEVALDAEFYGSIQPKGDEDWYAFEVPRRGIMNVSITDVPENIEAVFRVSNAEGSVITGWFAPLRAGADNIAVVDLPYEGRFYMQIVDANSDAANFAEYHVQLKYEPGDPYEPNGSLGQAAEIDPTTQLFGSILPKADHDWYVFEVDHPGIVNVTIGNPPANQDLTFRISNRERSVITGWIAPLRAGAENEAVIDLPITGRYYMELVDGNDDERSSQQYTLQLEYARADDYEVNNSFGRAADIAVGQSVQASILPKGDHDWFAFEAAQQGEYSFAITNVPMDLDLHLRVYNGEGSVVGGWIAPLRAGADTVGNVKIPEAGRYLVEIMDGGDDARAVENYALTISPAAASPTP